LSGRTAVFFDIGFSPLRFCFQPSYDVGIVGGDIFRFAGVDGKVVERWAGLSGFALFTLRGLALFAFAPGWWGSQKELPISLTNRSQAWDDFGLEP
jgi:hypothetical protein